MIKNLNVIAGCTALSVLMNVPAYGMNNSTENSAQNPAGSLQKAEVSEQEASGSIETTSNVSGAFEKFQNPQRKEEPQLLAQNDSIEALKGSSLVSSARNNPAFARMAMNQGKTFHDLKLKKEENDDEGQDYQDWMLNSYSGNQPTEPLVSSFNMGGNDSENQNALNKKKAQDDSNLYSDLPIVRQRITVKRPPTNLPKNESSTSGKSSEEPFKKEAPTVQPLTEQENVDLVDQPPEEKIQNEVNLDNEQQIDPNLQNFGDDQMLSQKEYEYEEEEEEEEETHESDAVEVDFNFMNMSYAGPAPQKLVVNKKKKVSCSLNESPKGGKLKSSDNTKSQNEEKIVPQHVEMTSIEHNDLNPEKIATNTVIDLDQLQQPAAESIEIENAELSQNETKPEETEDNHQSENIPVQIENLSNEIQQIEDNPQQPAAESIEIENAELSQNETKPEETEDNHQPENIPVQIEKQNAEEDQNEIEQNHNEEDVFELSNEYQSDTENNNIEQDLNQEHNDNTDKKSESEQDENQEDAQNPNNDIDNTFSIEPNPEALDDRKMVLNENLIENVEEKEERKDLSSKNSEEEQIEVLSKKPNIQDNGEAFLSDVIEEEEIQESDSSPKNEEASVQKEDAQQHLDNQEKPKEQIDVLLHNEEESTKEIADEIQDPVENIQILDNGTQDPVEDTQITNNGTQDPVENAEDLQISDLRATYGVQDLISRARNVGFMPLRLTRYEKQCLFDKFANKILFDNELIEDWSVIGNPCSKYLRIGSNIYSPISFLVKLFVKRIRENNITENMIDSCLNVINYTFKEFRHDLRNHFEEQIPAFVLGGSRRVTIAEAFTASVWKVMSLCVNDHKIQASIAKKAANLAYRLLEKELITDNEKGDLKTMHDLANQGDFEERFPVDQQ